MGFSNSSENAASFATAGSVWITDGELPPGLTVYGIKVWSDEAQLSDLNAAKIKEASSAVIEGQTFQRGDEIWGLGDIRGFAVTGTVQAYLIDPQS